MTQCGPGSTKLYLSSNRRSNLCHPRPVRRPHPNHAHPRAASGSSLCGTGLFQCPGFYTIPEGRTKPFGTVHAALCARDLVEEPFAIINADDYYGVSAFATILQELLALPPVGQGTMVGYRLKNTVSDNGTVSRGVCQLKDGKLEKVKETLKIKKYPDGAIVDAADPAQEVPLDPESVVSMNFWGFTPWIFEEMDRYFREFLQGLSQKRRRRSACCLCWWTASSLRAGCSSVCPSHRRRMVRGDLSGGPACGGAGVKIPA